jgi:hypothetical protein
VAEPDRQLVVVSRRAHGGRDTTVPSSWIVIGSSTIRSSGRRRADPDVTAVTRKRSVRPRAGTNGWEPADDVGLGVDLGINPSGFAELGVVLAAELVLGTIVVVVLLSSISQQRSNAAMAAFTGGAVTLATLFLLGISGAGINPARSLGMAVFADTDPNALGQVWVFVLLPIGCAFLGTLVWLLIDDATIDETLFDDTFLEDAADAVTGD